MTNVKIKKRNKYLHDFSAGINDDDNAFYSPSFAKYSLDNWCGSIPLDFFMHFSPGTVTTHAESINSDLQRGLDRRLRHTQH